MNLEKLKQAESDFLYRYPGGFENQRLIEIRKKHQLNRMFALAQEAFVAESFAHPDSIVEKTIQIIARSSLISVFEKTRFRDFAIQLTPHDRSSMSQALEKLLHNHERQGFEAFVEILEGGKLAKWSLATVCPAYYHPRASIFIKPTTTKRIIHYFELDHLHYQPMPTWTFYEDYRAAIDEMRANVDASLSPYYIAFTGFLMRSLAGKHF